MIAIKKGYLNMTPSIIPCKQNKCLMYPACLSKKLIVCDELADRCNSAQDPDERTLLWNEINRLFPKLKSIRNKGYDDTMH